jgi:hypothetical protein
LIPDFLNKSGIGVVFFSGGLSYQKIMKLQPVESSLIESVGDRETTSSLEVVSNRDKTSGYFEVPKTVYLQLMASDSKGSYIAILAGVVNFLPHPNPPRTRDPGVRNSQMMRGLLYAI